MAQDWKKEHKRKALLLLRFSPVHELLFAFIFTFQKNFSKISVPIKMPENLREIHLWNLVVNWWIQEAQIHIMYIFTFFIRTLCYLTPKHTLCHMLLPVTEDLGMSNSQRFHMGILLHVLYSNPKVLYAPNNTEVDEIIRKVTTAHTCMCLKMHAEACKMHLIHYGFRNVVFLLCMTFIEHIP